MWKKLQQQLFNRSRDDDLEFLPAALETLRRPPSPAGRILVWTIAALTCAAIAWACLGDIDEVAVAPGKIVPNGYTKTVQAEDKGVVKAIYVKNGQFVKEGEVLLELDPTISEADLNSIRKETAYCQLEITRLMAELTGGPFLPERLPGIDDKDILFQQQFFNSRVSEARARLEMLDSQVRQSQEALFTADANVSKNSQLLAIAREKENRLEKLVAENAVAYFVLLDQQGKRIELEQDLRAAISEDERASWNLKQSRQAHDSFSLEKNTQINQELVAARKRLVSLQEEQKKAEDKSRAVKIVSPVNGRVHQLEIQTLGAVVTPAQSILVIVPEGTELEVEAWVANKDIGFVHIGQAAEVKVESYNFQKFGTIIGEVYDLSPDAIDDKEKGRIYRALVRLDKTSLKSGDAEFSISPGMTVSAEIKTRKKKLIEFFLEPFQKYQSEALRER